MVPESYRWEFIQRDSGIVQELAEETGYPMVFAKLLAARGVRNRAEAQRFLQPSVEDMYDPFLMKDMEKAVDRILKAVKRKEKITIYGDYDVDGITATSILYLYLNRIGAKVDYYLPDRMTEGYGLNMEAIKRLWAAGTNLIVTVDTGITAIKECAYVGELGMEIVITDHHECLEELPQAVAVIDAKQPNETYPFRYLAGCGVAYKVVQGLSQTLLQEKLKNVTDDKNAENAENTENTENGESLCSCKKEAVFNDVSDYADISEYLELASVGTVADIVPLYDENRIIVSAGFKLMHHPKNLGLRKLLESTGYDFVNRRISSGFVGFSLAPRLNAGGRMGSAIRGVELFTTLDERRAADIANELHQENEHRKDTEQLILQQVTERIQASPSIQESLVMVVAGESWHHGVIGIVSSRIKDMYYRPNILLSVENGIATGSARSIEGFNLFEALCPCSDMMIKFRRHAAAAGMTLKAENIAELTRRLNCYAKEHMDSQMLTPVWHCELQLKPSDIDVELIEMIEQMEPFGQEMPEPIVQIEGLLSEVRAVGADGDTMRMRLADEKASITAIGFRKGILKQYYVGGMKVQMVGNLNINTYMGRCYPQLLLKDIHSEQSEALEKLSRMFALRKLTKDFENYCGQQKKIPRNVCETVYRFLIMHAKRCGNDGEGYLLMSDMPLGDEEKTVGNIFRLMQVLCVFEELELVKAESAGLYLHYELIKGKQVKLSDSVRYGQYFCE